MKRLKQSFRVYGLMLCLIFASQLSASGRTTRKFDSPQLTSSEVRRLTVRGYRLSSAEAGTLENTLLTDPTNLVARIQLVAYYTSRHDDFSSTKKSEHALWLIRNIPDSKILHDVAYARLNRFDKGYDDAKQLWLKHLEDYPNNLVVLSNAADFFKLTDKALAERLLKQLVTADPKNPRWLDELGHLYLLEMQDAARQPAQASAAADVRSLAISAYQNFESAFKLQSDAQARNLLRSALMTSAFEAGQIEIAQRWALAAFRQGSITTNEWSVADLVHHAHIILGRIALRSGDLPEARKHLNKAAESAGSPVLGSFGPNMMLAKELLEKGERDAVIEYFRKCAAFWKNDQGQLQHWAAIVREGGTPNFGANLVY